MLDPIILAFILGGISCYWKMPLNVPKSLSKFVSNFLLLAIGFKGGLELTTVNLDSFLSQATYVTFMGLLLPLLAFPILRFIGHIDTKNAASIAAHYGSVSVGTFAVGVAFLQNLNINYESYAPVFVAILEIPAILIGILLARSFKFSAFTNKNILKEIFFAKSIMLILFGIVAGTLVGKVLFAPYMPTLLILFKVILSVFLFDMGRVAAKELKMVKGHGVFLLFFGIITPMFFSIIGGILGHHIGLTAGGGTILAILAASASYIAVPAAMKISVPEASPSLSLTASLGITFPFNVILGIPLYYKLVTEIIY
jgi:hypothetical protein